MVKIVVTDVITLVLAHLSFFHPLYLILVMMGDFTTSMTFPPELPMRNGLPWCFSSLLLAVIWLFIKLKLGVEDLRVLCTKFQLDKKSYQVIPWKLPRKNRFLLQKWHFKHMIQNGCHPSKTKFQLLQKSKYNIPFEISFYGHSFFLKDYTFKMNRCEDKINCLQNFEFSISNVKCSNYWTIEWMGEIKKLLLFIHAWSGCDTTSAAFGKGKANMVNTLKKSSKMREISAVMNFWSEHVRLEKLQLLHSKYGIQGSWITHWLQ